jgi:hypothetical protein
MRSPTSFVCAYFLLRRKYMGKTFKEKWRGYHERVSSNRVQMSESFDHAADCGSVWNRQKNDLVQF